MEVVEPRSDKLWNGLLGEEGYQLASRLARELAEPFDTAATRVWTLIEAYRKAFAETPPLGSCGFRSVGPWITLSLDRTEPIRIHSVRLNAGSKAGFRESVLTLAADPCHPTADFSASSRDRPLAI